MTVLTLATGLLDVFIFRFGRALYCFLVGNLRLTDIGFNAKFALHAVNHDFELEFSHAHNNGFVGFRVGLHSESWVFVSKAFQGKTHFLLVGLGLWLNTKRNDRLGEFNRVKNDWLVLVTKRMACPRVFETDRGGGFSRTNL